MRFAIRRLALLAVPAAFSLLGLTTMAQTPEEPSTPTVSNAASRYEVAPETAERLTRLLPNSFPKLNKRQPCQIAVIGNTLTDLSPEPTGTAPLDAFPGLFTLELAKQFYYTGGVQLLGLPPADDSTSAEPRGPQIALRYLGRQDASIFTAVDALQSFGSQSKPDILFLCVGMEEARHTSHPARFQAALEQLIDAASELQIDLILAAPPLSADPPIEAAFGHTRQFTHLLRKAASDHQLPFTDLGDLSRLTPLAPKVTEPGPIFDSISTAYNAAFEAAQLGSGGLHSRLGDIAFKDLTEAPPAPPWTVKPVSLKSGKEGSITATFEVSVNEASQAGLVQLPLITRSWNPLETEATLPIPKQGKTRFEVVYEPTAQGSATTRPSDAETVLLPLLIVGEGKPFFADMEFPWKPIALTWDQASHFNVEDEFTLKGSLANASNTEVSASWTASWQDQTLQGSATLPPNSVERLELSFNIPEGAQSRFRLQSPLKLAVRIGKQTYQYERSIELIRNFALIQSVPLTAPPHGDQALEPSAPGITLRADADSGMLFLTCLLDGVDLQENPANGLAYECLVNLDARTYGKRLMPGATRSLRLVGMAADGDAAVGTIAPWAFGSGYAAEFDPAEIQATLDSSRSGQRRLTIAIPRTYLYLHEWALDNGNSQLGIDLRLNLWRALSDREDPEVDIRTWSLTSSDRHPDDAEGLAVLELATEATARWTVLPE